ncbi:DUF4190 domain-containing protein [Pseudonocardia sp. WMMC193]|uniref:DUF4190 domain-containing protein n=1 Tax=Pseudonocardia sp. WMMC193 TaxID=2911965 RepID=UPI001F23D24A|nr:DUF4190 domain-containing protein [Pseudonocardia sp. WMMC193]MCF7552470.1 DUF4190 domain-containing protein [Pseudonocardia sp. WMMC193]
MTMQNGPRPQHGSPQSSAPFGFQGGPQGQQTPQQTPQQPQWAPPPQPGWNQAPQGYQQIPPQYAPPQFAQPQYAPQAPAPVVRNGLALAALICGIVGILFGFIPLTFWVAGVLAVVAIPLALASLGRAKRGAASKGLTWSGLAAGVLALALAVWGAIVFFTAVSELSDHLQQTSDQLTSYSECLQRAGSDLDKMNACTPSS